MSVLYVASFLLSSSVSGIANKAEVTNYKNVQDCFYNWEDN